MGHDENIYSMAMANATYQGFIVWIPGCLPLISNTVNIYLHSPSHNSKLGNL